MFVSSKYPGLSLNCPKQPSGRDKIVMCSCLCTHGVSLQGYRRQKVLYTVAKSRYSSIVCASILLASFCNKSDVLIFSNRKLMRRTRFIKTKQVLPMFSRKTDDLLRSAIHRRFIKHYMSVKK